MIKPFEKRIYVTRPFLPPWEEFCEGLKEVWNNQWLTNDGPLLLRFTQALSDYYHTPNLSLFNNGTLALQIALQGMRISGEVITTPFTFVATTHALYWNKIRPVFVDIEPNYYTIDPQHVEAAITPWTTAILAVHVYGHPCNLAALESIAHRHNLKLLYDAAHAFGVKVGGRSIAQYGDMSMFSFHATKLFHSIEGGMLIFQDAGLKPIVDYLKNFGFESETEVVMPGTNAKMNEMQALMGLLLLRYIDQIIQRRKHITEIYRYRLKEIAGLHLVPDPAPDIEYNYAYFPLEVYESEFGISRDALYERLKEYNIFTRRYFYPLLVDFSCYKRIFLSDPLSTARAVASRILVLPIYAELKDEDVHTICDIIQEIQQQRFRNR
jgi:dTDP-4-amino-4,6-dideoxygalactose transaminase